ncbi:hypothetical protein ACHAW5_007022 [Stephanodiscus triporus]|uniref:MBD domain-containing protein n=1 Tax=Stephanodiscus triporus TaxID=2934178 RepID=A0ABD3P779_9STRA
MTRGIMLDDDPGTMTKAGGGDDGRKRHWNPTSSSQKKSKKLSSLALRALAALEPEGGVSSDDERDVKDSRLHDIAHSASGVSGVSEKSSVEKTAALEIDTVRSVVPLKSRNAVLHDRAHELHHIEHRGSGEDIRERNDAEICQNFHSPGGQVRKVHHSNERNPNMRAVAGSVSAGSLADNEPEDASPVAEGRIEEDEDCVCPHVTTSDYGDILSCFLSTPFDDKEMLSLHTSKEGTKTVGLQVNSKRRKWECVPILPQKIFIKSVKEKIIPTNPRESTHNGYNHGLSGVSAALNANISAQVNTFLMQECQKLIASTKQQQPIREGLPCRPVSHGPETLQHIHPPQLSQQHSNQQLMLSHVQAPKYFGSVQQQNSYFPMQMVPQVHRLNQQMNSWRQYPLPFAAPLPFFTPGIGMQNITHNNRAFAATAQQSPPTPHTEAPHIVHNTRQPHPQTPSAVTDPTTTTTVDGNNSQPNLKIALASVEIKLTDLNKDQIAKLPVAFGFNLDDDGTSKILAQAAAENWYNLGNIAAMKPTGITKATHKGASVGGSTEAGMLSTPKAPRISAVLIESSNAPKDLPAGWTSQKFKRANSENKTCDTYFFSPQDKIKFRSMKSCKRFIEILKEPTIAGNEQAALKEFKTRGHKM